MLCSLTYSCQAQVHRSLNWHKNTLTVPPELLHFLKLKLIPISLCFYGPETQCAKRSMRERNWQMIESIGTFMLDFTELPLNIVRFLEQTTKARGNIVWVCCQGVLTLNVTIRPHQVYQIKSPYVSCMSSLYKAQDWCVPFKKRSHYLSTVVKPHHFLWAVSEQE